MAQVVKNTASSAMVICLVPAAAHVLATWTAVTRGHSPGKRFASWLDTRQPRHQGGATARAASAPSGRATSQHQGGWRADSQKV